MFIYTYLFTTLLCRNDFSYSLFFFHFSQLQTLFESMSRKRQMSNTELPEPTPSGVGCLNNLRGLSVGLGNGFCPCVHQLYSENDRLDRSISLTTAWGEWRSESVRVEMRMYEWRTCCWIQKLKPSIGGKTDLRQDMANLL